ncbi:MAG: dihydropteroate synthase [Nitriliruptoraceae bacterium]
MSHPLYHDPSVFAPISTIHLDVNGQSFNLKPGAPMVMGIVNTNPGSFSDKRYLATTEEQYAFAMQLVEAGAGIIDVGTDSGVTYGKPIPITDQVNAAVPLVERLTKAGVAVSVDTVVLDVVNAVLDCGAAIINDVSGLADVAIAQACATYNAGLVILHTRVPHKTEAFLDFDDVVADIETLFHQQIACAVGAGVPYQNLVLDPGLGYSKKPEDDVTLLRAYPTFAAHNLAILTGASRKYYTGVITRAAPPDRLPETLATVETVRGFPGFVRVHDVDEVARFLAVRETLDGLRDLPDYSTGEAGLKWV